MGSDNLKNIKSEKAKAIRRFRKMQMITAVFRFIEFCMFLVIICRFSAHLHFSAFKLSGEYFRGLSVTLINPRFVFILGNAIFIVLFIQSGHSSDTGKVDFYEEYTKQSGKNQNFFCNYNELEIKKQRKRKMQRSQSENWKKVHCEERELRRSATTTFSRRKSEAGRGPPPAATEEMSSEDFRRRVEDFIARQQRALREEEFSVFVS